MVGMTRVPCAQDAHGTTISFIFEAGTSMLLQEILVGLQASWGGGGKGIRRVHSDEDVRLVFKQVIGEVPGSPVFTMKLAPQSRHIEVQLLCDQYGDVVSLFTRDCSIQRRHQKIVEEGPATAAPPGILAEMEECARFDATVLCACLLSCACGYAMVHLEDIICFTFRGPLVHRAAHWVLYASRC
jgi:biotin carboxylase